MVSDMPRFLLFAVFALTLGVTACESPAATGSTDIVLERVNALDVDPDTSVLTASALMPPDSCSQGPCDPNPCPTDPDAPGKTFCRGDGAAATCLCPPGTVEDPSEDSGCAETTVCAKPAANRAGFCHGFEDACVRMDKMASCTACGEGYMGEHCTICDEENGYIPDGFGNCSNMLRVCRDGQGYEAFQSLVDSAKSSLGHAPTELELTGARMSIVEGKALGVRSWAFLFEEGEQLTLFIQTPNGQPQEAATATVPKATSGLQTVEFDVVLDRPTLTRDPDFLAGNFRVGVHAPSPRAVDDEFSADVRLTLDWAAY